MEKKMTITAEMFFSKAYAAELQKTADRMFASKSRSKISRLSTMMPARTIAIPCAA